MASTAALFALALHVYRLATSPCFCNPVVDTCDIFCHGPLLDAVQRARLYADSKHFVDMSLKQSPLTTMEAFIKLANKSDPEVIQRFVDEYFNEPGSELETCIPTDWVPRPSKFQKILDPHYRFWAMMINERWSNLCRAVKREVHSRPELYSLIPVPRPFIIPGGRFLEFYYWDTYWIIKGLLASEMYSTAKDMILNLLSMVDRFGFIPNGGRIYYLNRSQPPLITISVYDYLKATDDIGLVYYALPLLEKEYQFWVREKTVAYQADNESSTVRLYQYRVMTEQPRAESYREDMEHAEHLANVEDKHKFWSNLASACESGHDFSSRFFKHKGPDMDTLRTIRTTRLAPVDLNSYICANERMLGRMHRLVGNYELAAEHEKNFESQKRIMKDYFWDADDKMWYDIDLDTGQRLRLFYASNMVPLFSKCHNDELDYADAVIDYLERHGALKLAHGIPSSMLHTQEQWDFPNGWPPSNHMIIEGLRSSGNPDAQELALKLATKWLDVNYGLFIRSGGKMFEKYNVEHGFQIAEGGEYDVQEGFGWSNGVVLDLLMSYGSQARAKLLPLYKSD